MSDVPFVYKYMPYRKEFFENFYLRCTPRSALNDPFELRPSNQYTRDHALELIGESEYTDSPSEDELYNQQWIEKSLNGAYNKTGIVSFSETKDNLLMWSHYADQHKGIVLCFDTSHPFFAKDPSRDKQLARVHYRKDRMKALPQSLRNGLYMADSTRIYFEKSDEWIYEKEYRLTCDLYATDATLCTAEYFEKNLSRKHPDFEPEAVTDKLISITGIENCCHDASKPEVLCMLQVPTECILSVICGHNMLDEQKQEVREYTQRLGISYLETVPDADEYKLNFIQNE
ncbi:MAG: hypothetical protein CMI00_00335 [Oceanospirillaceae bacterium]|mgnify:CR=1 FL=1|nr:hypothetical protein [Oceanospirillaceae bacterium]